MKKILFLSLVSISSMFGFSKPDISFVPVRTTEKQTFNQNQATLITTIGADTCTYKLLVHNANLTRKDKMLFFIEPYERNCNGNVSLAYHRGNVIGQDKKSLIEVYKKNFSFEKDTIFGVTWVE